MNKSIVAVVVTYNRKLLLMECLQAILEQTYPVSKILLIDNASTDGTEETLSENGYLVNPKINYIKMKVNTGGSGGFYEGMKRTMQKKLYEKSHQMPARILLSILLFSPVPFMVQTMNL